MKKIFSLILSILLLGVLSCPVLAFEHSTEFEFSTELCFPITTTEEWAEMDRAKRVAACQIPDDKLAEMSTDELLLTILEYPFMIDLFAFDSYREGFLHVYNEFSALQKLVSREDYGPTLVRVYQDMPVANITDAGTGDNTNLYHIIRNLSVLEILIAQPEMTDNLNHNFINSLVKISEEKYLEKYDAMDINRGNLTTFYEAVEGSPDSAIAYAAFDTVIYTPNRTSVVVTDNYDITDWSDAEKAAFNADKVAAYPNITVVHDPSKRYNCHSYAWYNNVPSNYYWMDNPSAYMTDGSYTETTSVSVGNKVYWLLNVDPEHSGIVTSTNPVYCESKWGALGVYRHSLSDCPYNGTTSYWTR